MDRTSPSPKVQKFQSLQDSHSYEHNAAMVKPYRQQSFAECPARYSGPRRLTPRPPRLILPKQSPVAVSSKATSPAELQACGEVYAALARRGRRHSNLEDRFAAKELAQRGLRPLVSLFGIFDGHGGAEASDLSSEKLFGMILNTYRKSGDLRAALRTAFLTMDETLLHLYLVASGSIARRSRKTSSMSDHSLPRTDVPIGNTKLSGLCGTTATVVALVGDIMTIAYVGDSRVIAFGKTEVKRLSEDHRESNPAEQLRCVREGGFFLKGRINGVLSLTRSIGDAEQRTIVLAEPEINEIQLNGFEAVIIASDGIWDVLQDEEVAEIARKYCEKGETVAVQRILDAAQGRGARDDVSAMIVNLKKYGQRTAKRSIESVSTPLSCSGGLSSKTDSFAALSLSTPRHFSPEPESIESLSPRPSPLPTPLSKRTSIWR
ncbi:Protein phosphatase 2C [Gracilaria domingensis]|nr:Protein phosphatase 2C [Gracilaria domingensis]